VGWERNKNRSLNAPESAVNGSRFITFKLKRRKNTQVNDATCAWRGLTSEEGGVDCLASVRRMCGVPEGEVRALHIDIQCPGTHDDCN